MTFNVNEMVSALQEEISLPHVGSSALVGLGKFVELWEIEGLIWGQIDIKGDEGMLLVKDKE